MTGSQKINLVFEKFKVIKKNIIKLLIYLLYNLSDVIVCNSKNISNHLSAWGFEIYPTIYIACQHRDL